MRATAGIAAERGGEEREAIGDARSPVSPSPPPARSGIASETAVTRAFGKW